ncbi:MULTISPECIES: hypothetical protein [Rhodococcus]|uniref:hypothetical protein n=1 Tax=Rhodococcus TaxID=1827 RepID=UPI000BB3B91E|nr:MULTISPECIES: hypothetical protein [Rhodococcus]PBI95666.1 hypothetical protein BKP42_43710 [Rhodococcus erythropolis]
MNMVVGYRRTTVRRFRADATTCARSEAIGLPALEFTDHLEFDESIDRVLGSLHTLEIGEIEVNRTLCS